MFSEKQFRPESRKNTVLILIITAVLLCLPISSSDISADTACAVPDSYFVVVDDEDLPGFSTEGEWKESSATAEYNGFSKYATATGASATWIPNLLWSGTYDVYACWEHGPYASSQEIKYHITT